MSTHNIFPSLGGNIYYFNKDEKTFFTVHPLFYLFDRNTKFSKQINNECIVEIKEELRKKDIRYSLRKIKIIHNQYLFIKRFFFKSNDVDNYRFTKLKDQSLVINNFNTSQQVIFEVTDKCNLNCTYCSYGSLYKNYDERYKKDMDFKTMRTVIDYYTPFWKKRAKGRFRERINVSFYGGEPLLRLDLIMKAIGYLEEIGLPDDFFTFSLTTNALLLRKSIDFLVKYNFSLLISLDGNEHNHSFRVDHNNKNSFDRVIENVQFIKEKYPKYFNEKVNFNAVLHSRNNYSEINAFFDKEKLPQPSVAELSIANAKDANQILGYTYNSNKDDEVKTLSDYFKKHNIKASSLSFFRKYCVMHYQNHADLYQFNVKKAISPTGNCLPFSLRVFVTANKKLLSCEKIGNQFQFGLIDDNDRIVIDTEKALKQFNDYTSTYLKHCRTCYRRSECKICAFRNERLDKDSICPEYISEDKFIQEVQFNISIIEKKPHLYNEVMKVLTT